MAAIEPKLTELVRILFDYTDSVAAATLAEAMDVPGRSTESYVQEINSSYPDAIESPRGEHRIRKTIAQTTLSETGTRIPQSPQERIVYTINSLIKSDVPVNAYDLCDEIFTSYSTVKNKLKVVG